MTDPKDTDLKDTDLDDGNFDDGCLGLVVALVSVGFIAVYFVDWILQLVERGLF